jgi:hypothetical protein
VTDKDPKRERDAVDDDAPPTNRPPFDPGEFARESERMLAAPSLATVRPPEGFENVLTSLSELQPDAGSVPDVPEGEVGSDARDAIGTDAVPFMAMSREELAWIDLEPDAVKLLACVNGVSPLDAVCAATGITTEVGASVLLDLAGQGRGRLPLSAAMRPSGRPSRHASGGIHIRSTITAPGVRRGAIRAVDNRAQRLNPRGVCRSRGPP